MNDLNQGEEIYELAKRIFPLNRSITGNGNRQTLSIIREYLPELKIEEVKSGTKAFDWIVPLEWNCKSAYIEDEHGERIIDFSKLNLHVVGYSDAIDRWVNLDELLQYIYVDEERADVVPYVTSYYSRRIGFCMSKNTRDKLKPGMYHMVIDSELKDGSMTYGELIIPGETAQEVFISTYICHPSMANNECSGPSLATFLAKYIQDAKKEGRLLRYTYRFVFIPETIGSIVYLSKHASYLREHVVSGYNLSCVGDNRAYSFVKTRYGHTITDKVLKHVMEKKTDGNYLEYSFLARGSDERQYNSPNIDLPVCSVCRSKYEEYPEYHTSADDLSLISPEGFQGAFDVMVMCFNILDLNKKYRVKFPCEPQLGKRGLYPTVSRKSSFADVKLIRNVLAYADGTNDIIELAELIGVNVVDILPVITKLRQEKLIY